MFKSLVWVKFSLPSNIKVGGRYSDHNAVNRYNNCMPAFFFFVCVTLHVTRHS